MDKFQNKYRIQTSRLRNWDYGWNASYFVTICTAKRECYFGEIVDGKMYFSEIGAKANEYWLEIPKHFPFVKLDVHVVMPNHVHGIIVIDKQDDMQNIEKNDKRITECNVGRIFANKSQPKNKFGPQSQNLASIIRGYKTGVTKYARNNNIFFVWQTRFHDHIIRDDASYQRIRNYIINNPQNWNKDRLLKNDQL